MVDPEEGEGSQRGRGGSLNLIAVTCAYILIITSVYNCKKCDFIV